MIGDLSNVSEMDLKWGDKVGRVIGMFSLPLGVGETVLGVLSCHLIVPLDHRELLRAVWAASLWRKSPLEVDVAMDEAPAFAIEQIHL